MTSYSIAEYKKMVKATRPKGRSRRPKVKGEKIPNEFEAKLARELKTLKIEFEQEFEFHPKRKWRADFHLVGKKILVEVEGAIWSGGRHTRGKGYIGDMEKYNAATMMGFQVLRFSTEQVKSGLAIEQIEKMVGDLG
ncbi:endonuclease domain-containing protein [Acinetobacter schindleri]|uniref:endonuclease domain-containing protein n=1 Tax=Acinetobacter schindleri TaxID=108981 RepID=UPI0021CD979B|nr:endonuclease domain-containing protein [Acinetobacter schindleri]MCU4521177.1 endonuclease domain-containing protein [Acinetobacter schindleri]